MGRYIKDQEAFKEQVTKTRKRLDAIRAENHKNANKYTDVAAHQRAIGMKLKGQDRKDSHWVNIFTLCSLADRYGVTEKDKEQAREYIELLTETFLG